MVTRESIRMSRFDLRNFAVVCIGLLALACTVTVQAQIVNEIVTDSDYRFRDVAGVAFGPLLDTSSILEAYLDADGFDTRTGIEFPASEAVGCLIVSSATLTVESSGGGTGTTDVFGFEGDGTPILENLTNPGPYLTSVDSSVAGTMVIDLPTEFIQDVLAGSASHFGFALVADAPETQWILSGSIENPPAPLLTINCSNAPAVAIPVLNDWLTIVLTFLAIGALGTFYVRRFQR